MDINDISFYVPTRGRTHRVSPTLTQLGAISLLHRTFIVCPFDECMHYEDTYPEATVFIEPKWTTYNLCKKRAWMFDFCDTPYFFMIDDDVQFTIQHDDRSTEPAHRNLETFRELMTTHLLDMFSQFDTVAWGLRLFCNNRDFFTYNRQTTQAWGYNREAVREDLKPAFGRLALYHDMDWCLTLLEAGHKSIISSHLVTSSRKESGTIADGGLGLIRTPEMVAECADKFYELHKDYVTRRGQDPNRPDHAQSGRFTIHWKRFQ